MTGPLPTPLPDRRDPPDPIAFPYYYQGITGKRMIAYLIDVVAIVLINGIAWLALGLAGLITFGLLFPLIPLAMLIIPFAYHVLQIGGTRSATLGMRVMGLEVVSLVGRPRPELLQAAIMTVVFYATVPTTGFLVMLFMFFNPYRRALQDYLSGTIVLNKVPVSPT
jgi:uncharacterized RDD family membrane protein YckC